MQVASQGQEEGRQKRFINNTDRFSGPSSESRTIFNLWWMSQCDIFRNYEGLTFAPTILINL
jgi:hypothetical protein